MSAYVVVDITITDAVRYEEYKQLAAATVTAYGGRYIVRGGSVQVLEGTRVPGRTVVLEFPSTTRAQEWWASTEYAPAKQIRQQCAETSMILVPGV